MKYFILDDDKATRRMLSRLITDGLLGDVIGEDDHPISAIDDIIFSRPDIVLIDLLMQDQDGIETVQRLKDRNFKGKFIMISQVVNKDMVAKAYEIGIEYFIHKPINRVEVSTIINKVKEHIKMEQSLERIRESLSVLQIPGIDHPNKSSTNDISKTLHHILGDLGILGESGSQDLVQVMEYLSTSNQFQSFSSEKVTIKDLFINLQKEKGKQPSDKEIKAFEQRLRRTVNQAMSNIASLGLTDYSNPKFEDYATKFFDFSEIRLKISELEENSGKRKTRINLRKFIYALYTELTKKMEESTN